MQLAITAALKLPLSSAAQGSIQWGGGGGGGGGASPRSSFPPPKRFFFLLPLESSL